MPLLERVTTLLRANVNALIEKAEDPEKLLKQLVLDMENQLLQVKTQLAIAIADEHLLAKKKTEHEDAAASWQQKAALAVHKEQDDLARAALDRSLSHHQMAEGFAQQLEDHHAESANLREAFGKLQQKLTETQARCEMLLSRHRRARVIGKATQARQLAGAQHKSKTLAGFHVRIQGQEAANQANHFLLEEDSLEDRFSMLEREEQIDHLLTELKQKRLLSGSSD